MASGAVVSIIVVLCIVAIFMLFGCRMKCGRSAEGYRPSELGQQCSALLRSPVDYVFKDNHGYQQNPHYQANPSSHFQPLNEGPIDFFPDARRLEENKMYDGFGANFAGDGKDLHKFENDEHNRFNLTNIGSLGERNYLDDVWNKAFGPYGFQNTEQRRIELSEFERLYGGNDFFPYNRSGL